MLTVFRIRFPYTYSLSELLTLVEQANQAITEHVRESARLSDYAVEARYPGLVEPLAREEYEEAVSIAETVIRWAEEMIGTNPWRL